MAEARNQYVILGLAPEATPEDIRETYQGMARRFHPDTNPHPGARLQFDDLINAYDILSNPVRRKQYDAANRQLQNEPNFFTLRVTSSKRVLGTMDEPQVVYLLLTIVPIRLSRKQRGENSRLNLSLVLDRSTSMRGERLEKVKTAAQQIIDQLSPDDALSVVSFSDRADVLIPADFVQDKIALRAMVSMMRADGGTEMFQGLSAGFEQCQSHLTSQRVNHIILLTDGETFGDEEQCLELAARAAEQGVRISAMGIGDEWNDVFLDSIASITGGSSAYINAPSVVTHFLNNRVRRLGNVFTERLRLIIAPDADVTLESAFKLSPTPQPIDIHAQPIAMGALEFNVPMSVLVQLLVPPSSRSGVRTLARFDVTGDVLVANRQGFKVLGDSSIEVSSNPPQESPPLALLDALGKLSLYRMQQKAEDDLQEGHIQQATQRLENLATRLLAAGKDELAHMAMEEARHVHSTQSLSEEGRKSLKFGTRKLLALSGESAEED